MAVCLVATLRLGIDLFVKHKAMRHSRSGGTDVVISLRVRADHRRLGSVARQLVSQPFLNRHDGSVGPGGVVSDRQRIRLRILDELKLAQPSVEPERATKRLPE